MNIIILVILLQYIIQSQSDSCQPLIDECLLNQEFCKIYDCTSNISQNTVINVNLNFGNYDFNITTGNLNVRKTSLMGGKFAIYSSADINISEKTNISSTLFSMFASGYIKLFDTQIYVSYNQCTMECSCQLDNNYCNLTQPILPIVSILRMNINTFDLMGTLSFYGLSSNQQLVDIMVPHNFTLLIISEQDVDVPGTLLNASRIGLYARLVKQDMKGVISANGNGCRSQLGFGCGFDGGIAGVALGCYASGASHGGLGGYAVSEYTQYLVLCMKFLPRLPYNNPALEGSGGGGDYGGSGGGLIYIEAVKSIHVMGIIDASGTTPLVSYSTDQGDHGCGSGGSIQLHSHTIYGVGYVKANGGGDGSIEGYGGPGAGGRVLLNLTQWMSYENSYSQLKVQVNGGDYYPNVKQLFNKTRIDLQTNLLNGTIYSTPCLQGYEFNHTYYRCTPCQIGYYKATIGHLPCQRCMNSKESIIFNDSTIQIQPICLFSQCKPNYQFQDGKCITWFELYEQKLGGDEGTFALLCCLSLLLLNIIFIIVRCRKLNVKKRRRTYQRDVMEEFDPSSLAFKRDESSAKADFIVQDLPYHVIRVFFEGVNTLQQPWNLKLNTQIVEQCPGVDPLLVSEFIANLNKQATYSRAVTWSVKVLQIIYYPLYYYLSLYLKRQKYLSLSKYIVAKKIITFNTNETGIFIKFSASPDYSLAFIDVLSYDQDPLQWNNQTKFPVSLVLTGLGSFLNPLQVHMRDPLVRSLNLYFQHKRLFSFRDDEDDDEAEMEADRSNVASFDEFIMKFNQYACLVDFMHMQGRFIQAFMDLISFVEYENEEIFKSNGITIDLCVHLLAGDRYPHLQSKIIMLSFRDHREIKKTLKDVHFCLNFCNQWSIRFSINFERHAGPVIHNLYEDQVVLITESDLNKQIQEYRLYEDEREELNNLKQKMIRRMDRGIQTKQFLDRPIINYFSSIQEEEDAKTLSCSEYINNSIARISRVICIVFTYYIRFRSRSNRMSPRITTTLVIITLLIQMVLTYLKNKKSLVVSYPLAIAIQMQQQEQKSILYTEIVMDMVLFPFSWLFSPLLLCYWVIESTWEVGKKFLVMNLSAVVWGFFLFMLSIIEFFIDSASSQERVIPQLELIKMGMFINLNAMAFLGCYFIKHNDQQ